MQIAMWVAYPRWDFSTQKVKIFVFSDTESIITESENVAYVGENTTIKLLDFKLY